MRRRRQFLPALVVTLVAIIAGAAVARADSTTLLGYRIDLVNVVDNGDRTSTWTYAVTADGDESKALSLWTLEVGACYLPVIEPKDGSTYTTPTGASFGCGSQYQCQQAECTVVFGTDPQTGISGIKYENCTPQVERENQKTHIFQFTVHGVPRRGGDVQVAVKAGTGTATGAIQGPVCSPTAVSLREFSAQPEPARGGMGRFLGQLAVTLSAVAMRIVAAISQS